MGHPSESCSLWHDSVVDEWTFDLLCGGSPKLNQHFCYVNVICGNVGVVIY